MTTATQPQPPAQANKNAAGSRKNLVEELPWLPLTITMEIPVPDFTIQKLLDLRAGSILNTLYLSTADVPMRINGKLIAWGRFEVSGDRLASRITELA